MSNQLSARLTADVKGYKKAIEDAQKTLKVFNSEESATAQTMRQVYDVSQDQVKAYKKVLDSMTKATDGTKTMKQASNLLKNDIERLRIQWDNLSDTAKRSNFGKAMANSIRQAESQLKGMQSQVNAVSVATQATNNSMSSLIGVVGKFAPAIGIGATALQGLKDAFFNTESNIDEWGRTVEAAKGTYQTFLDTINNGNWSNFFKNVGKAQKEMRNLYDLYDYAGSTNNNNQIAIANQERVIAELRRRQKGGEDVGKQIKEADNYLRTLKMQGATADKNAGYQGMVTALGADIPENVRKAVVDGFIKGGQDFMNYATKRVGELGKVTEYGKTTVAGYGPHGETITTKAADTYAYSGNQALEWEYKALKALVDKESNKELNKGMQSYLKGITAQTSMENASRKYESSTKGGGKTNAVKLDEDWLNADVYEELPDYIRKQNEEFSKFTRDYAYNVDEIISNNMAAHNSTLDFLSMYDRETLAKNALSGLGSLNSGISSIYDTLSNLGEMDNPFKIFDGMIGIAQNVMGVVDTIKTLCSTMQTMSAVSSATAAMEVANSNAQTSANTGEAVSETLAQNAKLGPIVGTITGVAMVGTMIAALLASKSKVPKFADGGIVYGPTMTGYGLTGEYASAKSNPEVIAPLSRLKSLLKDNDSSTGGVVEFRIQDRELVGILNKSNKLSSRR